MADWIERRERLVLGALLVFYLAIVLAQASVKLVWADELITFYIAKQPGLSGVWHALRAGADPNPPLMHMLVKASTAMFGDGSLAIRLPAVLCVLLAILAMWWMLRRWVSPAFALAGVLAFMATRGFDYSYDARSYAPMMGFAMASLALWMAASDLSGWRRTVALAGMAVALAAGISSNYYCVLAFFPIAAGELFRRFRPGVWLAMAAASLPHLAYLQLIRNNIAEFAPHAWNRPRFSMVGLSYIELVEGIFWPVLALGLFALWKRRDGWTIPRAEAVAVAALLVYPFLGFAIAVGGAGMISPRCVAPVCCGFGLAAGLLGQRLFARSAHAAIFTVLFLTTWVVAREGFCATTLLEQRRTFLTLRDDVAAAHAAGDGKQTVGNSILVSDSSFVFPLVYYSNREVRRMLIFPIDFDAIHRFEKDDSGEQNIWGGRGSGFPFQVVEMKDVWFDQVTCQVFAHDVPWRHMAAPMNACHGVQVVIARPDGWLSSALRDQGFELAPVGDPTNWQRVGGVFTPMAHPETRIMLATRPGR